MTIFDDLFGAIGSAAKTIGRAATSYTTFKPRRIAASLVNHTQQTLIWVDSGVAHGPNSVRAPETIGPHDTGKWGLESDGFQKVCEGWMKWRIGNDGPVVRLDYNNPHVEISPLHSNLGLTI
ncbi:hypothetical protein FBULB1_10073 [Fusarium bulbicola]|nr:hypothetical protein FBULB1_10073 [Fusarium bulbicola]